MVCAAGEAAADAKDLAALGLVCRAQDRSEIDFARVPGLGRTSMDAHGDWIAGPATVSAGARAVVIRRCFYLPAPAAAVTVVIRSWRNSHPFRLIDPEVRPAMPGAAGDAVPAVAAARLPGGLTRDGRIALGPRPVWFRHGLVPGRTLVFKGQVIAQGSTEGALARIAFRDARGSPIPPPYPETLGTLSVPAFLDIPVHRQAYRFTLKVAPPPHAATLEIGFATWDSGPGLALAAAPDLYLDEDLRLADLADDPDPGAEAFLARLLGRLGDPIAGARPFEASIRPYLDPAILAGHTAPLRGVTRLRDGPDACLWTEGAVRLASRPPWTLPEVPDWAADPFRSQAWRLAFQALSWTWEAAESSERAVRNRAVAAAVSWSRANPWGQPADVLSLHPACMALRLEALLGLLAAALRDGDAAEEGACEILGGEVVRHAAALGEILAQRTVAESPLEVQVAASLLAAGLALPSFPMARHWTNLAMNALLSGFTAMIDADGALAEPSYHRRLEILTLAAVLKPILSARPDLAPLAAILDRRLPRAWAGMSALFEPDGALPPFDDAPDHAGRSRWLARLTAALPWLRAADPTLGITEGGRLAPVAEARHGVLVLRRPDEASGWSAFTADFSGQIHPRDHRDCTSFTFATGGFRWITEGGGAHPAARVHNVALPDGREPTAGAGVLRASFTSGDAAVHCIETSVHGPDYRHIRAFVILPDLSGLAVFDRFLAGDRPVSVEGFLHLDASVTVALDGPRRVSGLHGQRRLHIIPHMLAGRFDAVAVDRAWAGPDAQAGAVLRYGFSGVRCTAGGLLIAASQASLHRLTRAVEDAAFRRSLVD
ncbi:MAG: hypothetical protein INR70_22250 [Parafilimonas terrae]|nr:hypothetical protein [Parafilimonas terrae]